MYRIPLFAAIVISVCVLIPVAMRGNQSRVRVELLRNMGLADLLRPTARSAKGMHFPTTNRKQLSEP